MRKEAPFPVGSVDARERQRTHYGLIVVGAGVAGSTAAAYGALQGMDVVMVDPRTFPSTKICGDAVNSKALKEWHDQVGFEWEKAGIRPQKLDQFRIVTPNGRDIVVPLLEREGFPYVTSRRMDLDNAIHQHARSLGVEYRQIRAREIIYETNERGQEIPIGIKGKELGKDIELIGDHMIGADGSTSIMARELGFSHDQKATAIRAYVDLEEEVPNELALLYLEELLPAYAWFFTMSRENGTQVGNIGLGFLNEQHLRAFTLEHSPKKRKEMGMPRSKLKYLLQTFVNEAQDRYPMSVREDTIASWQLPIWTDDRSRIVRGVPVVGDAGSNVDPLFGEGIAESVITAVLAGQYVNYVRTARGYVGEEMAQIYAKQMHDMGYQERIVPSMKTKLKVQQNIASNKHYMNAIANGARVLPEEAQLKFLRWLISPNNRLNRLMDRLS